MMFEELQGHILKVSETRVWRTYTGGKRIDQWHGRIQAVDGDCPEDWVASTVKATNPGREAVEEGLSHVLNHPEHPTLKAVLESAPDAWFGTAHASVLGAQAGVLVKLIDSAERLTIQVHPDKQYAKEIFHSDYGKTESWYILGGDSVNGEPPCVYLGFKPGTTRELWQEVFDQQDIPRMLGCLHKIPVKTGDAFFIEGGVPHAIGAGCFLAEVQEPTDYTMRTELVTPAGLRIHDKQCHQGVGYQKMLDCFHYDAFTLEETLCRWQAQPVVLEEANRHRVESLIDDRYTKLFGMRSLFVGNSFIYHRQSRLSTFIVAAGAGTLSTEVETLDIKQGDFLVVPACIDTLKINCTGETLHLVESLPPAL